MNSLENEGWKTQHDFYPDFCLSLVHVIVAESHSQLVDFGQLKLTDKKNIYLVVYDGHSLRSFSFRL